MKEGPSNYFRESTLYIGKGVWESGGAAVASTASEHRQSSFKRDANFEST